MVHKRSLFLIINIIIPLVMGGLIYCITSPDTIFVRTLRITIFRGAITQATFVPVGLGMFIRFYFLDMLWGYALVFALVLLWGNSAEVLRCFLIAVAFSVVMESLQLVPAVLGTFDLLDILAEVVAEGAAALFIKSFYAKEVKGK